MPRVNDPLPVGAVARVLEEGAVAPFRFPLALTVEPSERVTITLAAAPPFTGETMHDCQASYAYNGAVPGIPPVAIGCDMTGGCSGGPWVWQLLGENALNGNNSYRQSNRPEEINSPYFDDRAKSLWDTLLAGTP